MQSVRAAEGVPRLRMFAAMIAALLCVMGQGAARADEVRVAAAANFTDAAKEIGAAFSAATGHTPLFSFGSTGQLYAQIAQDAPFEVFLAADQLRPRRAVEEELAVPGSRFTYSVGKLVLYSRDAALVKGERTLQEAAFTRIAIANPVTAPYGAAALDVMKALGVHEALAPKIVRGNNIAQAYQFVATGNAEIGFVALSQVAGQEQGSRWPVPSELHAPIAQDAVLLRAGQGSRAARAFLDFLGSAEAHAVLEKYGYAAGD